MLLEVFIVGFGASFLGTVTAFGLQYWLYKKQTNQLIKLKKSLQGTVRRLKKK